MSVFRNFRFWSLLLFFTAAGVVFSSPLPQPNSWIPLVSGSFPAPAQLTRLSPVAGEFNAKIRIPGLLAATVSTQQGPRTILELSQGAISTEVGAPRLPVLRYLLETPPGVKVLPSLHPLDTRRAPLAQLGCEAPLFALQHSVRKNAEAEKSAIYKESSKIYSLDAFYPARSVDVTSQAIIRGRWVTTLEIRPFRYNPVQKTLEYWTEAELVVQLDGRNPSAFSNEADRLSSALHDRTLEGLLIPVGIPPQAQCGAAKSSGGGAGTGAEGLLIIVHDSLADAIAPLADWRKKTGWKVEVLKTSAIGKNPSDAQIKSAIDSRYRSWSNPALGFLLLVGDTNLLTYHLGIVGENNQAADNWFGCLDGTDYLPELAVGRISTRTAQETSNVVAKLMTYYKATFSNEAWIKKVGFIGTADQEHYAPVEATHDFCIDTYLTPNGFEETNWTFGGSSSDRHFYTTKSATGDIAASINEGRMLINYSGHGAISSWQGPTSQGSYGRKDVLGNTNAGMYPFVIANASNSGQFDREECLGETWLKAPNGGAIAQWGATGGSYWDGDDFIQRSLYTHIFPMDSTPPLGIILNQTKLDLFNHSGDTQDTAYYYDIYNLLGDPTTSLWTRPPMTLSVAYPQGIPLGQNQLNFTVTSGGQPIPQAMVGILKNGEPVFEGAYTDANGQLTMTLDPAPANLGKLEVMVTKHDYRPFETTIEVFPSDAPWLAQHQHQIDDQAGGDGDGMVNPGETFVMPVTLENLGHRAALGILGTLTTSTPALAAILDGQAGFPDASPSALASSLPDHYRIQVPGTVADGQAIGFDLHWTTTDGQEGTTSFSEVIKAVNLAIKSQTIDDSNGNHNGIAGPGETINMTIRLANLGHKNASTIHGKLTTASPYATIIQSEADFPNLSSGAEGDSLAPGFRFKVSSFAPDKQPIAFQLEVTEQGSHYTKIFPIDVFISSCTIIESTGAQTPIPDGGVMESRIDFPNSMAINEVNTFVDITHPFQGDLIVTLISPNGTSVLLHNRTGLAVDDIFAWYDTETAPVEPLIKLNGQDSHGTWILRVEDASSKDAGTLNRWKVEACGEGATPIPRLQVAGFKVDDSSSCDPDGFADVGERATYKVKILNAGNQTATNVQVRLASTSRVEVLSHPVILSSIPPGAEAEADFLVRIGAVGCVENAVFTLSMTSAEGTWTDGLTDTLETDLRMVPTVENLEHGGAAPDGWTHNASTGIDDWSVQNSWNHTANGNYSWFVSNTDTEKMVALQTPLFKVNGKGSTLDFWHRVDLQGGFDGGLIQLSDDNGFSWYDLESNITAGAYHKKLAAGPLEGRMAWTGPRGDAPIHTVVNLDEFDGKTVKFEFLLSCDKSLKRTGWHIDDIVFTTIGKACDIHPCGIPEEAQLRSVTHDSSGVVLTWKDEPLAVQYKVYRSTDPTKASAFTDVTGEDAQPSDTTFVDQTTGVFAAYIITVLGPDQEGPWGHFGR